MVGSDILLLPNGCLYGGKDSMGHYIKVILGGEPLKILSSFSGELLKVFLGGESFKIFFSSVLL